MSNDINIIYCRQCVSKTKHRSKLDAIQIGKLVCNVCDSENSIKYMERPDKWAVIKITVKNNEPIYKVLAAWVGGYLDGDYWKLNSGIERVEEKAEYIAMHGFSGSCYLCPRSSYGTSSLSQTILETIIEKSKDADADIEIMPCDTNWIELINQKQ